jgi:hypothetical protein
VALAQQAIGKEADHVEAKEPTGEEVGPEEHPQTPGDRDGLLSFITAVQKRHHLSDREICARARVSHHTLAELRDGEAASNVSLRKLTRAAEEPRREVAAAEPGAWSCLERLRNLRDKVGGEEQASEAAGSQCALPRTSVER